MAKPLALSTPTCFRLIHPLFVFFLILVLAALACNLSDLTGGDKPIAIISSPPSGSAFREGEEIAVESVSTGARGVVRVELIVDGKIVLADTTSTPQNRFVISQTWQATRGTHTIIVRAYDPQNNVSNPAAISVQVLPAASPTATSPLATTPTAIAGSASPSPIPGECINNSAYIADVTVPDGSLFTANQGFNKIWRLRNNGTCAWGAGYQFVFLSGDALTSNRLIAIPNTSPGATADILVPMNAPSDFGSHTGYWRLRSPSGALFGQVVTVKITVPGASPAQTVVVACNGTPNVAYFTADVGLITWGGTTTLRWGPVTNADGVEIDQGVGGIAAGPSGGSVNVSPTQSAIYTMTARCGSNIVQKQVTILVPFAVTGLVGSFTSTAGGACPQTANFEFVVSVNSAGTVHWRRERSDGTSEPSVWNHVFEGAGSYTAAVSWQFGTPGSGTNTYWIQLHTTSPTDVTSNQVAFNLTCP